jgi:ubiquinone/menaquinone biosynthesis C-methylase UbiE
MNIDKKWDKFWKYGDVGATPTRKNLFKKFKEVRLLNNAKILDAGCGSGTLAKFWKDQGYDVVGLDISDKSLEITHIKGIGCIKGDVTKGFPFRNNTFDLIYSDGLLEHFVDPKPVLGEMFRVSKKYVITIVPRNTLYNFIHNLILRPPTEYKKRDLEWVEIHKEFDPKFIEVEKIKFGVLMILCRKG